MFRLRTILLCLLTGLRVGSFLQAENRVFLLPPGGSTAMSVLRASDLSLAGTITATGSVFGIVSSNAGDKYYITSRRSTDPILVVNPQTLAVIKEIPLGVASTNSVITPDGRYLLIVSDRLRIIRTDTDQQVGSGIPVGTGPRQVIVDNVSRFAYVLSENGRAIQVIDLEELELVNSLSIRAASAISLSEDDSRLAAVLTDGVVQFRTSDYQEIDTIPALEDIINGEAFQVPGSSKLIVTSRGSAPRNTAQIFDLSGGSVKAIGSIGSTGLRQVAAVDNSKAYAILASSAEVAVIDLTNEPEAGITTLPLGTGFDAISLSPNRKTLFVSSLVQSQVLRVNVANNAVLTTRTTAQAPSGHAVIFDSSTLPAAQLVVHGGDGQFTPPGNELLSPLSVRVVDAEGSPVTGVPVFFTPEPSTFGVEIRPGQPSVTNRFGVATGFVRILPVAAASGSPEAEAETEQSASEASEAQTAIAPQGVAAAGLLPPQPEQAANPITQVRITASSAGVVPLPLTVNVIRGTGIIKVSGDFQITAPNRAFADPFTVLVTDNEGRPVPPRTVVNFSPFGGTCNRQTVETDSNGFASVTCFGGTVPGGGPSFVQGGVSASVSTASIFLPAVQFSFTVAFGGDQMSIVKLAGDGQSGDTETQLPIPLTFRVNTFTPIGGIGVHIRQISGPAVSINPAFLTTFGGITKTAMVTLGQNAGQIGVEVSVIAPNRPRAVFNLTAVGGQPQTFQKQGDGQTGRIGSLLPNPLRLIVFDESGQRVAFPDVEWSVLSGSAEIAAMASEPTSASARIRFGDTPGAVIVRARIAGLVADFTLTATPPQPVSISTIAGQNQTITVGSLSTPLTVRVAEAGNIPAGNVIVTFNGPANVLFRPADGAPGANPLQVRTGDDGVASARAELLRVAALNASGPGPGPSQIGNTVLVTATVGDLTTTFQLSVIGRLPSFQAAGVVNAANRAQPGQPDFLSGLVPGGLATLFGTGLSEGIAGVDLPGGATSHKGTTLRIGGIPAPLLAIKGSTPEQINFQAPFSIPPGQTTTVEVDNNGNRTTLGVIPVFSTQPGLFELTLGSGDRTAALLHQDVTNIVTPQFPARKGEVIVGFFTGGGQVNPPVTTGQLGPIPAPVIAREVSVTVDNQNAEVLFGGYAPGFLGLYQINFRVPQSALCGTQELNVRVGDTVSPFSNVSILCE